MEHLKSPGEMESCLYSTFNSKPDTLLAKTRERGRLQPIVQYGKLRFIRALTALESNVISDRPRNDVESDNGACDCVRSSVCEDAKQVQLTDVRSTKRGRKKIK